MYNQNFYNPAAYNMGGAAAYGRIPTKFNNPLTQEELNSLLNNGGSGFNLKITADDKAKGICTHKDPRNGQSSAILQNDGSFKCYICGESFKLVENPEMVQKITEEFLNILQTIKSFYVDIPDNVARSFFAILPLVKQVPALYKLAQEHFNKFDQAGMGLNMTGNVNPWQAYSAIQGMPNGFNQPMMQQGMMGGMPMDPTMGGMMNGMQQGMMQGQPMMDPNMMAQMGGMQQGMMGMSPAMNMPGQQIGVDAMNNPIYAQQQMANMYAAGAAQMGGAQINPFYQAQGAGFGPGVQPTAQATQTNPATPGVTVPGTETMTTSTGTTTVQTTKTTLGV